MSRQLLATRVDTLERRMDHLSDLPERVKGVESQLLQMRAEMASGFSAIHGEVEEVRQEMRVLKEETRQEMRVLNEEVRQEVRALNDETRREMRVLYEDVIDRLKLIHEDRSGARAPGRRPGRKAR